MGKDGGLKQWRFNISLNNYSNIFYDTKVRISFIISRENHTCAWNFVVNVVVIVVVVVVLVGYTELCCHQKMLPLLEVQDN